MRLDQTPAAQLRNCKIKRVYPPFRFVSTPRCTRDLPVVRPVYRGGALGIARRPSGASEWRTESPSARLRNGLTPRAWSRFVCLAARRESGFEQLLRSICAELA